MRKISLEDTFKMARLIKNANIAQCIKDAYFEGKKEGTDTEELGFNAMLSIICSCCEQKTELQFYDLLAGITEKTADEIKSQPLEELISDIKEIDRVNNISNFMKSAFKLSKAIKN